MILKIFLFLLLSVNLFSSILHNTYYVNSRNIKLQDILPNAPYDVTLYQIEQSRHTKKIKSKQVLALLKKHGFEDLRASSTYIQFVKKSPIDTSKIRSSILEFYKEKHPNINIDSIILMPRAYLKSLPQQFEVQMQKRAYLSHSGTLSIKTLEKKKLFFDYMLDAKIDVYRANKSIKKGIRISALNTLKKTIQFDKLRAMPVNVKHLNTTQSRRNIKADTIITTRDIENLNLVKRGANVSVNFEDGDINISFSAKALQNGKLNDIITVQKRNKKRLKAKVVAKNRVEIQ